ncbi:MAG: amidohydrolase family protein [Candidatus Rokubacteria bacterium]|nr:amidohydrolase family protein [Candidatus Rokubacteria bacterium]
MAKAGFRVLDSDLHVIEPADLYGRYLDKAYKDRAPRPLDAAHGYVRHWRVGEYTFPRPIGTGRVHAEARSREILKEYAAAGFDAASQLRAMDVEGIDVAVHFRTLPVVCVDAFEPEFALALCRAWNDWMADFCALDRRRMKAAALLTLHDATLAARELHRAVTGLGFVAAQMMPNPVNGVNLHDPRMDPLWAEAEQLGVPIGFHPAPNNYAQDHFINRFLTRPSSAMSLGLNNPVELMAAVASMTAGGVLERFPHLRVAFLEGNCSWLPWLLWRLDEYWEMCKGGEAAKLQALPSEYFRRQCFISVDPDEDQVEWVIQKLGDDNLVFSTDYPHSDSRFPEATVLVLKLPVSDRSKRKILWDNCARLYGL